MAITSACFDLECSSLHANFGIVLCAVIKPAQGKMKILRADKLISTWATKRADDSEVVKAVTEELSKYDILAAHNGKKFDIPYLRTRLARWGLTAFPRKKLIDPYQLARNHFALSSNSLSSLCDHLPIRNTKTIVSGQVWMRASLDGDRKAMDEIVDHCVADVKMLEDVIEYLKDYSSVFDARGSGW